MDPHIAGLLKHHHIRHSRQPREPGAWASSRKVQNILPVNSEVSYATALHEIGHILGGDQQSRFLVVQERGAWDWAQQHALTWTPAMKEERRRRMAEYEAFGPRATGPDWIKDRYVVVDGQLVEKTNSLGNGGQTNWDASIPREPVKRG
jgi:hypothetical protein